MVVVVFFRLLVYTVVLWSILVCCSCSVGAGKRLGRFFSLSATESALPAAGGPLSRAALPLTAPWLRTPMAVPHQAISPPKRLRNPLQGCHTVCCGLMPARFSAPTSTEAFSIVGTLSFCHPGCVPWLVFGINLHLSSLAAA